MITLIASLQTIVFLLVLLATVKPLGWYMAKVYEGKHFWLNRIGDRLELFIYRACRIKTSQAMDWKCYLTSMLIFNLLGLLAVYLIQRLQIYLPLNPHQFPSPTSDLALNTAVSFATNTNWQAYAGETTMSYFTQMLALTPQNFISAATGMSLLVAISRGIAQHESTNLGNFWVDMVRSILYILLPLSFIFALILVSQGVIQNIKPNQTIHLVQTDQQSLIDASGQPIKDKSNTIQTATKPLTEQVIPMGPVASQVAIKQLGTNGGGFFNTNSAHPFENPTPLSNFLEMLAILLIPAALCYTFGELVHDRRQGWAILTAMFIVFIPFVMFGIMAEQKGNPALTSMGISPTAIASSYPGGNMEGKETRFGITSSALWSMATTAASNGSVNSMLDSYTPLGGLIPLWMMHLNEAIFGGAGSGLYGMLMFVILTVFVTGLMVGRTPEYLGKKIEPYEMKMASVAVLVMPLSVLVSTALAVVTQSGLSAISNPGMHGFTEVLYTFTSIGNNNGSAFSGLNANTPFYNLLGSLIMLISRYWIAIPTVALAGSLAQKKIIPQTTGTLATHTPLFIILLICIIFLVGALSFLPALALGPIVEHLTLWGQYGS
ncbi:potassium-transporting ATPase subunit KdpA [Legionella lytica]|uniref:Potassium-transporting ATPase potassium-binding subunit n=1 Tax=Legionella lytica TaxID=96232 RepID=A0ABY4YA89_9GAMM|nr:potassium-transporting ATPase subunit KdpA [Legionella lytica]USQ14431.1 potassium-transporting ATPase subunit KdpA [Legionella lytica]